MSGSGTLRQTYSVLKLWSSTHFFTTASSFTIFTRDLNMSNGIRENFSACSLRNWFW